MSAADQLSKLLDEIDDDTLAKMSDDDVLELRKKLNPYGRTIQGSDKVLTFSHTGLQAEYLKKMCMTAMVGYLNTMLDEWRVPDGVPVVRVYDYVRAPELLDEFEKTLQKPELLMPQINENKKNMKKRVIVKEFLEDMFQYNPDMHVRSAYKPNYKDPDRDVLDTPAAQLAIRRLKQKDAEFREEALQYERLIVLKKSKEAAEEKADEVKQPESLITKVRQETSEMIPPADTFHRFRYYYDSNYEELKHIVTDLYCDKSEFELAINPYDWHADIDDADKFISKHRDEVITEIFKAHSGKWNFFAPFKQVRESMRYFNKDTAVLESIAKQIESDQRIGKDMMEKRITIKKKKNIEEEGADSASFIKWKSQNTTLKDMGAVNPKKEDYEDDCPDDAIECPVIRISGGGTKVTKSKFYTQAIAPEPVEKKE
jgi:hypothetical protein